MISSASGAFDFGDMRDSLPPHVHHQHQHAPPPAHLLPMPTVPGQRRRGVTKFFNSLKGFGFVVDQHPEELGGQEVFCHFSAIAGKGGFRSLAEGEEVEYELVQGPKGFQASNLTGPGGRNVVGDPKARLTKPPTYLPFAPLSMPLSPPYISDPYQQQHTGVYSASPYTQHVLYVPSQLHSSSLSHPQSQYAYTSIPPPQPQGSASLASAASSSAPFGGSAYSATQQPYQPGYSLGASSIAGGAPYGSASTSSHGGGGGVSTSNAGGNRMVSTSFGSFSPPGGSYASLADVRGSSNPIGGGSGGSGGVGGSSGAGMSFAPFNSPPPSSNPPLFGNPTSSTPPPPNSAPASNLTFGSVQPRTASTSSSFSTGMPTSTSGSSLFGGNPTGTAGAVGSGVPRSNASRNGTPVNERRGTPLGNGSLNANGAFGGVLYKSGEPTY